MSSNRANVARLAAAGRSDTEIADALGLTPRAVRRIRARAGIPSQWTPTPPAHGTRARYQRGCPCDRCAGANAAYTRHDRATRARAARQRARLQSVATPDLTT